MQRTEVKPTQTIGILCLRRRPKQRDMLRLSNSSVQLRNPRPFIESCIKVRLSVWGGKADEINLDEVRTERRLGLFIAFATSTNEVNGD